MSKSYRAREIAFAEEKSEGRHLTAALPKRETTSERQVRTDLHGAPANGRAADGAGSLWPVRSG